MDITTNDDCCVFSKCAVIGKSVSCDLQMPWDITSPIAPEQAEVKMINGYPYLMAMEEGSFSIKNGSMKRSVSQK